MLYCLCGTKDWCKFDLGEHIDGQSEINTVIKKRVKSILFLLKANVVCNYVSLPTAGDDYLRIHVSFIGSKRHKTCLTLIYALAVI